MRLNILLALAHLSLAHENFTTEETPFTIKDDLFSTEEMSPMSPSSDHFAAEPPQPQGPPTSVLPDAEPPGIQPQPPGEQESLNLKSSQRTSGKRSESERTTTTTAQYGDSIGVSSAVSSADNEEMHNELLESSGEMKRGLSAAPTIINTDEKEGCPTPEVCTQNCFVYINDQGCQDCQCLWQALACDFDEDCPESAQFCDLGRCNCRPGLRQDMKHSGSCEQDPDFKESTENEIRESGRRRRDVQFLSTGNHLLTHPRRRWRSMSDEGQPSRKSVRRSASHEKGDVHPPAPPPSLGHVSRMLIDRTIDGTFPNLPPLQPFTKLISEPVPAKNKTVKEIGKQKGRRPNRLVEFPISSHFSGDQSESRKDLLPLPLSVHPTEEEIRRHNLFKKAVQRRNHLTLKLP
ncbi:hypothetical protein Q1695_000661 [Nippostrongylus brasiliensis]|nr:hypothetical protein Q1695_000661 [Nippostrongylus brasiliensis]